MQSVISSAYNFVYTVIFTCARGETERAARRRGEVLRGDTSLLALRDPNTVSPRGHGHGVGARCGPTAP